ncbi:Retrovirus-related Pol polyprotein LINE-1 [Gossypium australe]|uniref:Retrovirus-related Pol polyprotein LINE-1 n=1 Tax=Gossypium australe TaxID=47621 RepID=A0A5B6WSA6_9ROSI|nr:Retrovirus-related Pol polyprotein LINE-1 [Gossypium australe]
MSSISSSFMQILWNRVPTQKFKPNRGIRQGCPLSPYLFVLCMEWLGHFIRTKIETRKWDSIQLSCTDPSISHLFFADYLVIFCKAQFDQSRLLESILTQFCEVSGHRISVRKNNIFFSKNTEADVRNQISQLFRINVLIYGGHFPRFGRLFVKILLGLLEMALVLDGGKIFGFQEDYWKIIWKYSGPQRVRVFLWLAFKQRILTNLERVRQRISHSNSCTLCGHDFEDLVHVLRDCPSAKDVWRLVIPDQLKQRLRDSGTTWSCLFGLIAWHIWKNRNLFIFQHISWMPSKVVKVSSCWARHYDARIGDHNNNQRSNSTINSEDTWVYLSTDGAVARDSGYAATGGVARDRDGNWIVGFNLFLGVCSPFEA